MTRKDFIDTVTEYVQGYIDNPGMMGTDPQIEFNPVTGVISMVYDSSMLTDIGYSDEVIESAAAAERAQDKEADDYQAAQNPDFYAVRTLVTADGRPDIAAIENIATDYAFA